ncbi:MAG: hypothetical protein C0620_05500 [Desulfuromonas sp.]|nr:MAG: hypothetical protein C0620_05500 [Desulfuromonas sp.]
MKHLFVLLILLLILSPLRGHASSHIQLVPGQEKFCTAGHLEHLTDADGSLTLHDIINNPHPGFTLLPGFPNCGYTHNTSWLHFTISRQANTPHNYYLWVGPPMLDEVSVYVQQTAPANAVTSYRSLSFGDTREQDSRPIHHSHFIIPLDLPDTTAHHIYIRLKTKSSHNLQAMVLTDSGISEQTSKHILVRGGFLAILFILTIINLLLAYRIQDKRHLYFGFYLAALFCLHFGLDGFLSLLAPHMVPWLSDVLVGIGNGMSFAMLSLFCSELFQTKTTCRSCHLFLRAILVMGVITMIFSTSQWYAPLSHMLMSAGLVFMIVMMSMAIRQERLGVTAGRLFLFSFAALTFGGSITFLHFLGLLPTSCLTVYAFQVGSLCHIVLMTLALSERFIKTEELTLMAAKMAEDSASKLAQEMTFELERKSLLLKEALDSEQQVRIDQSKFIDMVSHEYRTPLAILQTNLDIIDTCIEQHRPVEERHLNKMYHAVQRLAEVFYQSCSASFSDHQTIDFSPQDLKAMDYLASLEQTVTHLWDATKFSIEIEVDPAEIIRCDRKLLNTALFNLVDNALKYRCPKTLITILGYQQNATLHIDVINQIDPAVEFSPDELLGKNQRGVNTTGIEGQGMGLYLVNQIMEQHGGDIVVEKISGNLFLARLRLPLIPAGDSRYE